MSYHNIREEELKNQIARDYFSDFDTTKIVGNIDFCITHKVETKNPTRPADTLHKEGLWENEIQSLLWAEAKKGKSDILKSIVQLILTIGKARTFGNYLPPAFLGAFDAENIAFVPYHSINGIFTTNDFNWNVTPSNHETREFQLILNKVKSTIEANSLLFAYATDDKEIREFIKTNLVIGKTIASKINIDKNNFLSIYNKWLITVKPSIIAPWELAKKSGIIDADFYLADLLSENNQSLKESLYVLLKDNHYEFDKKLDEGFLSSKSANFYDDKKVHTQFWNRYNRPPREEYWDYIIERRDLLVPQDVRERKGSFFTPSIWVDKSQEYLTNVLGENWQDDYYIWDCAAGTGNLLAGLTNKYNIYASTLDTQDVDVMKDRIKNGTNLLADHCFQFDFLNDEFTKLPQSLQEIIADPLKRQKLVIYINPPYAEATSGTTVTGTGENKAGVATSNKSNLLYKPKIGNAGNELFALFMARIYDEIPNSKLAQFSKLKFVQGGNFLQFRGFFLAKYLGGFVVQADTFDNVKGKFPIGFTIWDTSQKQEIKETVCDVLDNNGNIISQKGFYGELPQSINKWLKQYDYKSVVSVGYLGCPAPDFQHNSQMYLSIKKGIEHFNFYSFQKNNLVQATIYFTVRNVFEATWLNDRDQFLFPNDGWMTDLEFQNDCLAYTLFHGQNRISSKTDSTAGVNNWIPFTESEVNARERFASNWMTDYMKGKLGVKKKAKTPNAKTPLTEEQKTVLNNIINKLKSLESKFNDNKKYEYNSILQLTQEEINALSELELDCNSPNIGIQIGDLIGIERNQDVLSNFSQEYSKHNMISTTPLEFTLEAQNVFYDGRELWRYYHSQENSNVNASLYDIREYFQGRNKGGKMNNKSTDEKYTLLISNLRDSLKVLGNKIQPKVYEYGFLKG